MKKLLLFLSFFIILPIGGFAFDVKELKEYDSVAIKTFTRSDSMDVNRYIQSTAELERLFAKEREDFQARYVYMSDSVTDINGDASWRFFFPESWNSKGKGKLIYEQNYVMKSAKSGDTLVIARKSKKDILLVIAKDGSDEEKQLFEIMKIDDSANAPVNENKSTWSSLWNTGAKKIDPDEKYIITPPTINIEQMPKGKWVRIYFTPSNECENGIIEQINKAKKMDIAVYSITNKRIGAAILDAHKRGAKIRIITDRLQSSNKAALADEFAAAGIPVRNNKGSGHKIEHNKWVIFDGKEMEYGSYNWTEAATKSNSESCMFFAEPKTKDFTGRFKYLWDLYEN